MDTKPMATEPPRPAPRSGRVRIAIYVALGILIGGAILAAAAWYWVPPYVERVVLERARANGVVLQPTETRWSGDAVVFERVNFELVDVPGVQGRAQQMHVALDGLTPTAAVLRDVAVRIEGTVSSVTLALTVWSQRFASSYRLPLTAKQVGLHWVADKNAKPWLVVASGSLERTATGGGLFRAERVQLAGMELGVVSSRFSVQHAKIAIGLGETNIDEAPLRVQLHHAARPPTADITLERTPLTTLAAPLGLEIPLEGVTASGVIHLELSEGDPVHGPITGSTSIALQGFIPPHPRELEGFFFGDVTQLQARFAIDNEREHVALRDVRLLAGRFQLSGTGSIVRKAHHALVHFDLTGQLPCTALARAAAEARLDPSISRWVSRAAKRLLQGNVDVKVKIEADTRKLDEARVERRIGVGCGLKPLEIPGVGKIKMPKLPKLPTQLPELPSLPSFGVEVRKVPPAPSKQLSSPSAPSSDVPE